VPVGHKIRGVIDTVAILEWAAGSDGAGSCPLDRAAPETVPALAAALAVPRPIEVVERIEQLATSMWPDVLAPGGPRGGAVARECGAFFSRLGYFFKYKPYGVKIASPFGYSLFDLHDGEGFSFQLHVEPKIEAFHFLRVKERALVYLSGRAEWASSGAAWAAGGLLAVDAPPAVRRPVAGDVVTIPETGVVHSVLGCVLEEYASCSVDAVERLFDQNSRLPFALPPAHPSVSSLLASARPGLPACLLSRTPDGWAESPWPASAPILSAGPDLWGARVALPWTLDASDELVTLVVAVDGPVSVSVDGAVTPVAHGAFACLPPGLSAVVAGDGTVAVHRVSRAVVQQDWTR
jgi:hypothetical protein